MPTRTVTEELCDVCFVEQDGKESAASDRLRFRWEGQGFVLLACAEHIDPIRDELQRLSELATREGGRPVSMPPRRPPRAPVATVRRGRSLYAELSAEDKQRFRVWADLPKARRISDERVTAWSEAGKP